METDIVSAAKRFEAQTQISLYDLSVAMLLECFSWPLLRLTNYKPLGERTLLPAIDDQLKQFSELIPEPLGEQVKKGVNLTPVQCEVDPDIAEAIALVGAALARRTSLTAKVHPVGRCVVVFSGLVYFGLLFVLMRSLLNSELLKAGLLFGAWLSAMLLAMLVCLTNRHWRPCGVRRSPS